MLKPVQEITRLLELKKLNWDVKHPNSGGNILEEQEAKHFDPRFDELLGKDRPDFLIYVGFPCCCY